MQPEGVIDVHAHWLPRDLFGLPPGAPYGPMNDRDGQLYLGDLPLSIATEAMSDEAAIVEDMARAGVAVRVLSAPPFAFPLTDEAAGADYVHAFNTSLSDVVSRADGKLLGLAQKGPDERPRKRCAATPRGAVIHRRPLGGWRPRR